MLLTFSTFLRSMSAGWKRLSSASMQGLLDIFAADWGVGMGAHCPLGCLKFDGPKDACRILSVSNQGSAVVRENGWWLQIYLCSTFTWESIPLTNMCQVS